MPGVAQVKSTGWTSMMMDVMMVVMMMVVMMVMVMMGPPGEVYGVDINTGNSGALYADSFVLHEHYR